MIGQEPAEVEGAGTGGTCVWRDEVAVRVRGGEVQGLEEERTPSVHVLCAGEYCNGAASAAEAGGGMKKVKRGAPCRAVKTRGFC
jgi:hypothetical protein